MKSQINKWSAVFAGLFLIALVVIPLVRDDIGMARNPQNYMSQGWQEATQYLRSRLTPEQEAEYTKIFKDGEKTDIPYVLAWWDNGYWIVRESHMPVICNPGGGVRDLTAQLLLSENPNDAVKRLKELNIKYVVIDSQTAIEKFYSVVQYARLDLKAYYDTEGGELFRTSDYYKTFLAQLFWFDAKNIQGIERVFVLGTVEFEGGNIPEIKVFEVQ